MKTRRLRPLKSTKLPDDIPAFQKRLKDWVDSLDPESACAFLEGEVCIDETHTLKRRELIAKALLGIVRFETTVKGKRETLLLAKKFLNIA